MFIIVLKIMTLKFINRICLFILIINQGAFINAQENQYIDNIVAIIGEEVVLKSDIEKQFLELHCYQQL